MTERSCIIGLGSPFGADQFGWLVIERLRQNHALQSFLDTHVELISADRPGLNLLQLFSANDHVILIDAIENCTEPGKILRLDKAQLLTQHKSLSTHNIGVAETLALGEKLGDLPERLVLLGMCVDVDAPAIDTAALDAMEKVVMDELGI